MRLLEVDKLEVTFSLRQGALTALRDVSFTLEKGERLGIVGESGAGKSVVAYSIVNLISKPGVITAGNILFEGQNLALLPEKDIRRIRGNRICMIFQDPMMTLNPVLTIGTQMVECLKAHRTVSTRKAKEMAIAQLEKVRIPSPETRIDQYPHELSGGMRQRVVIAIALLTEPELLIADEPTTALDVTIQAEIMDLLLGLCEQSGLSLILITHDLGVVSQVTQRLLVMYAGRIVEQGLTREVIDHPQHPYTQGLIKALPESTLLGQRLNQIPGMMPTLAAIPSGCAFHDRCGYTLPVCRTTVPDYVDAGRSKVACHWVAEQGVEP